MTTLSPWFDTARLMNGIHRAVSRMQVCHPGRGAASEPVRIAGGHAMADTPTAELANPACDGSKLAPKRPHARSSP
jgi:hypothetical protein